MFKKGGIFLSLVLFASFCMAQTQDLMQSATLINLNEATAYTGQPFLYIEGIKAPEKANNEMEELQLKLFGTKDIQRATRNTLQLSDSKPEESNNQQENYTFTTPFGQSVQAAFIPHIPDFVSIIQVLDKQQITISEHITVINTDKEKKWKRSVNLPPNSLAQITHLSINGQAQPIPAQAQADTLLIQSDFALPLGPNKIVLKYNLTNAIQNNTLNLNLTGTQVDVPINRFKALITFSTPINLTTNKLLFGTNKMDIPDIYTQQTDKNATTSYVINRIIPEKASIQLQMSLDSTKLPSGYDELNTSLHWINLIVYLILLSYWGATLWWENKKNNAPTLPKIKYPKTLTELAHQIGTTMTHQKWQALIQFGKANNWPLQKLQKEQQDWQNHPKKTYLKTKTKTFFALAGETLAGTILLALLGLIGLYYVPQNLSVFWLVSFVLYAIVGVCLTYKTGLKKIRQIYWRKKLLQLEKPTIMAGLTQNQVRQVYPLFILANHHQEWRTKFCQINPTTAIQTHLNKEKV